MPPTPVSYTDSSRVIDDRTLLFACQLVTQIPDYYTHPSPDSWSETVCALISNEGTLIIEDPLALQELKKKGWKLLDASHWSIYRKETIGRQTGYQGIILIHPEKKLMLLTHRGMQVTKENIAAALDIGEHCVPAVVDNALAMCQVAELFLQSQYQSYQLYHTGFSMGGFLAQVSGAYFNNQENKHNQVICFDAPSATLVMKQLKNSNGGTYKDNAKNVRVYLTAPNPVNTAGPHAGYVRQISGYYEHNPYNDLKLRRALVEKPLHININFVDTETINTTYDLLNKTLETHDLKQLINVLGDQDCFPFYAVTHWPIAVNNFSYEESEDVNTQRDRKPNLIEFLATCATRTASLVVAGVGSDPISEITHRVPEPVIHYGEPNELIRTPLTTEEIIKTQILLTLGLLILTRLLATRSFSNSQRSERNRFLPGDSPVLADSHSEERAGPAFEDATHKELEGVPHGSNRKSPRAT